MAVNPMVDEFRFPEYDERNWPKQVQWISMVETSLLVVCA